MTAKPTLANPRLASKVIASQKAGVGESTPTHIAAILNRLGKLERQQRAAVPDQLLRRLDALGKIVANLQESHRDLARYLHQELVEIREALMDVAPPAQEVGIDPKYLPKWIREMANPQPKQQVWPVGDHGSEIDVDAFAQDVHDLRPNAVIPMERGAAGARTPSWMRRWLSRFLFR